MLHFRVLKCHDVIVTRSDAGCTLTNYLKIQLAIAFI